MGLSLEPDNAAKSLIAHVKTWRKEMDYIAAVYARYEGLKSLDNALEAAGVLADVQWIQSTVTAPEADTNGG